MLGIPKFARDEDFFPRNARLVDATTDFIFVAVNCRAVDVAIPFLQRTFYRTLHFMGSSLQCSEADSWDLRAGIESEMGAKGKAGSCVRHSNGRCGRVGQG